jgi:cytochrome c oxidase cbb3-type subunit 4
VSSGLITLFAMLAFLAIVVWVFLIKRKEDFDEQANLPLDEDDRRDADRGRERKQETDKENQS